MVSKVHSGVFTDQVLAGSLRAFAISGLTSDPAAGTAGGVAGDIGRSVGSADGEEWILTDDAIFPYDTGTAVPNSLADLVYRVLSTRSTVVSIEFNTALDEMHVILENAAGWGYHSVDGSNAKNPSTDNAEALEGLIAELDKLVGLDCSSVAITPIVTDGESNVVGGAAVVVEHDLVFGQAVTGTTIGGIGGNEHDQDTYSNDIPAPE